MSVQEQYNYFLNPTLCPPWGVPVKPMQPLDTAPYLPANASVFSGHQDVAIMFKRILANPDMNFAILGFSAGSTHRYRTVTWVATGISPNSGSVTAVLSYDVDGDFHFTCSGSITRHMISGPDIVDTYSVADERNASIKVQHSDHSADTFFTFNSSVWGQGNVSSDTHRASTSGSSDTTLSDEISMDDIFDEMAGEIDASPMDDFPWGSQLYFKRYHSPVASSTLTAANSSKTTAHSNLTTAQSQVADKETAITDAISAIEDKKNARSEKAATYMAALKARDLIANAWQQIKGHGIVETELDDDLNEALDAYYTALEELQSADGEWIGANYDWFYALNQYQILLADIDDKQRYADYWDAAVDLITSNISATSGATTKSGVYVTEPYQQPTSFMWGSGAFGFASYFFISGSSKYPGTNSWTMAIGKYKFRMNVPLDSGAQASFWQKRSASQDFDIRWTEVLQGPADSEFFYPVASHEDKMTTVTLDPDEGVFGAESEEEYDVPLPDKDTSIFIGGPITPGQVSILYDSQVASQYKRGFVGYRGEEVGVKVYKTESCHNDLDSDVQTVNVTTGSAEHSNNDYSGFRSFPFPGGSWNYRFQSVPESNIRWQFKPPDTDNNDVIELSNEDTTAALIARVQALMEAGGDLEDDPFFLHSRSHSNYYLSRTPVAGRWVTQDDVYCWLGRCSFNVYLFAWKRHNEDRDYTCKVKKIIIDRDTNSITSEIVDFTVTILAGETDGYGDPQSLYPTGANEQIFLQLYDLPEDDDLFFYDRITADPVAG